MVSNNLLIQPASSPLRLSESNVQSIKETAVIEPQTSSTELKSAENVNHPVSRNGLQDVLPQAKEKALSSAEQQQEEEARAEKALNEKVKELNDFVQNLKRDLHFSVDKETGRMVVRVVNAETDEVIKQIPSDEILKLAESLENMSGLLINKRA